VVALQLGLRRGVSPQIDTGLEGRVLVRLSDPRPADFLLLDRAELLEPDADGRFRFDDIPAGEHELTIHLGDRLWRRWVTVQPDGPTRIDITVP